MRVFLLLFGLLFCSDVFAQHKKFNPNIQQEVFIHCGTKPEDGSMGGCATEYIYIYPKNVDKMIKENPEFMDAILRKNRPMCYFKYNNNLMEPCDVPKPKKGEYDIWNDFLNPENSKFLKPLEVIEGHFSDYKDDQTDNCYELWKYNAGCGKCTTVDIKFHSSLQVECNEIVKKVLKKTGKLY